MLSLDLRKRTKIYLIIHLGHLDMMFFPFPKHLHSQTFHPFSQKHIIGNK